MLARLAGSTALAVVLILGVASCAAPDSGSTGGTESGDPATTAPETTDEADAGGLPAAWPADVPAPEGVTDAIVDKQSINVFADAADFEPYAERLLAAGWQEYPPVGDARSLGLGDYSLRLDPTVNAGQLTVTLIAPEGDFTA